MIHPLPSRHILGQKLSGCAIACKDDTIEVLKAAKARDQLLWKTDPDGYDEKVKTVRVGKHSQAIEGSIQK